jgi:hypothetical protein
MPRPKLNARLTIRLYDELLADVQHVAANRRFPSTNAYVLHCLEYEMSRAGVHAYDSYGEILPILNGEVGRQLSDDGRTHLQ